MHSLGAMIRARRRELGLTLDRLAASAECHKSYLSQIENEKRPEGAQPSESLLARLERALRLPEGRLVRIARWNAMPLDVREEVRAMETDRRAGRRLAALLKERTLDGAHATGELAALVHMLAGDEADAHDESAHVASRANGVSAKAKNVELVPLALRAPLINRVSAGYPTEFTDLGFPARVADEYVSVPDLHDADAFAARVVGDSMAPEYREGDIVVFSPEREARSGDDCFVRFERDAETTFKRVFFEERHEGTEARGHEGEERGIEDGGETIRLQPLNPKYAPRELAREDVAGLYVAVWVIRSAARR